MSYKPTGGKTYTLGASIGSTNTTIRLSSFTEPVTGTPFTMAILDTEIAYGTIAPKTNSAEFISFTGITQNSDGTADLTGVVRGLAKVPPFTTSVAYKLPHSGQSIFILSDAPQVFYEYAALRNDNTYSGVNTFSTARMTQDPSVGNDLTRASYVQAQIAAAVIGVLTTINVILPGKAGTTITAGQLIYFDDPTNRWLLCDADTAATVENVILGIAQGAGTAGNAITGGVMLQGVDTHQTGISEGDTYYASNTAGGVSTTPGTIEVTIGIGGQTSTELYFYPRFNQQITENQQDALAGNNTDIPVGTGNKYVTQTGLQHNAEKYAADAGVDDTYVITLSPAPTSYTLGMVVYFKANTVNTGAATINVNGLGAVSIVKGVNTPLGDGDISAGMFCTLIYDGTNFVLTKPLVSTDIQTFTANSTWTKPSGAKSVLVQAWGAGGAGGAGNGGGTGTGGGGGGGGAYIERTFNASDLSATEAIVVGAGGTGGSGNGPTGANSTFGTTKVIAYAGGGGAADGAGGGGGGIASIGVTTTTSAGGNGGDTAGGAGGAGAVGGASLFGGGGGGASGNTGFAGGLTVYGGGGGGGGATNTGAPGAGGAGASSFYGGGGGAGGRSDAGTVAGGTSIYGGAGGGSSYGIAGTAGSIPGGGGGGGSEGTNGGSGARGQIIVTTYF